MHVPRITLSSKHLMRFRFVRFARVQIWVAPSFQQEDTSEDLDKDPQRHFTVAKQKFIPEDSYVVLGYDLSSYWGLYCTTQKERHGSLQAVRGSAFELEPTLKAVQKGPLGIANANTCPSELVQFICGVDRKPQKETPPIPKTQTGRISAPQ